MDPAEIDALVQRLVADPHDEAALAYAHEQGAQDPKSYAFLLEKVGTETPDPSYASHWLSEAANVWSTTLGDAHRAARVLMMAIDKDPTQAVAAERLAQLYRDKGDYRGLVALLERRTKALGPLLPQNPDLRGDVAGMHEELGRLWSEPPLNQPKKAIESYRRAIELDPNSAYAIFQARELLKAEGRFEEALPLYQAELALERDSARRLALMRDEATTRRMVGDLPGSSRVLEAARRLDEQDAGLAQEYAGSVLDRVQAGEPVPHNERTQAAEALVGLAEQYDGEHGYAYASGALDLEPGHDRALQLFVYYGEALGRGAEAEARYAAYLQVNPAGALAEQARTGARGQAPGTIPSPPPQKFPSNAAPAIGGAPAPVAPRDPTSEPSFRRAQHQGPPTADMLQGILDAAQMLAGKGKKPEAYAKYREVLEVDPAHPEALAWAEEYLRTKRDYAQLRDVLLASVRYQASQNEAMETRKDRLREVAGLCEGNLRDVDGAVSAWKQLLAIDRTDEAARTALTRLLEKQQRWDDLANLLEQEATAESDIDTKIALEKKLALLHEQKRKDFAGAAEAWARIARLTPDDDRPTLTSSKLFEKAGLVDMAAQIIADNAATVDDAAARGALLERLGELRELLNDALGAGEAYADAADVLKSTKLWESAERCFVTVDAWDRAAHAAGQRAALASDPKTQASHYARAADQLARGGDDEAALARLEQATDLDPFSDEYANLLGDRYRGKGDYQALVAFLAKRGDRVNDRAKRVAIRRQTAHLYATQIQDKDLAREHWLKVLEDGDDREALEQLVDYAVEREDHNEAVTLLRRLLAGAADRADKTRIALREAELLAEGIGDVDTAIARYEQIISELDATCRPALQAIADLQETREEPRAAADALERELKLVSDPAERGQIAGRLARLYDQLDDPTSAIRALDVVRKGDPEDFDALARLCDLCEKTEQWDRVAQLLAERIEVEGDEEEASAMTRKLASILAERLSRGDEALAVLTDFADQGEAACRQAYVDLGDKLGWKGIVAQKLVEWWFEAKHGPERIAALRGAFDRFDGMGREQDAVRVALEIVQSKGAGADKELAERLEALSVKTNDHDALCIAHDLLSREATGPERALELVRQAEVRAKAGMPRSEAIQHGEAGLTSVSPGDAEPLLERLAAIAPKPNDVVDLYERQVSRSKAAPDRIKALARAAQVAVQRGQVDRARGFFELALSGTPNDETLEMLENAAREGDASGGEKLRRALCAAMAAGGQGARDGGRTRGSLLRRAATMIHQDLADVDQAFAWLGDALVAHVDAQTLDALEGLARGISDPARAETVLSHALNDVFDGPLVRQLLARRATIRREQLDDKPGAAADLKKLHDLSPTDQAVMGELAGLLTELGDFRGMVQLYEDQLLRGKDMNARAELARKVARMWEEQLADPREAADAWRRVLRMKPGDAEATAGLERAKSNMLKKPDPNADDAYMPPRAGPSEASPSPSEPRPSEPRPSRPNDVPADSPPSETLTATISKAAHPPSSNTIETSRAASQSSDGMPAAPQYEALSAEDLLAEADAEEQTRGSVTLARAVIRQEETNLDDGASSRTSPDLREVLTTHAAPNTSPAPPPFWGRSPDAPTLTVETAVSGMTEDAPVESSGSATHVLRAPRAEGETPDDTERRVRGEARLDANDFSATAQLPSPSPLDLLDATVAHGRANREGSGPALLVDDDELIVEDADDLIEIVDAEEMSDMTTGEHDAADTGEQTSSSRPPR